jgi:hypothetical protein
MFVVNMQGKQVLKLVVVVKAAAFRRPVRNRNDEAVDR